MKTQIIALLALAGLSSAALARPAITIAPATMRAGPTMRSPVVQQIPDNAEIDVVSCSQYWCNASWRNMPGYIPANAVAFQPAPPPPVYAPPVVVAPWGWGPGYGYYGHRRHW